MLDGFNLEHSAIDEEGMHGSGQLLSEVYVELSFLPVHSFPDISYTYSVVGSQPMAEGFREELTHEVLIKPPLSHSSPTMLCESAGSAQFEELK